MNSITRMSLIPKLALSLLVLGIAAVFATAGSAGAEGLSPLAEWRGFGHFPNEDQQIFNL